MKDNVLHSGSGKVIVCLIEILFAKHACAHIFNITSAWSGAFCSNWKKVRTNDRGYIYKKIKSLRMLRNTTEN